MALSVPIASGAVPARIHFHCERLGMRAASATLASFIALTAFVIAPCAATPFVRPRKPDSGVPRQDPGPEDRSLE